MSSIYKRRGSYRAEVYVEGRRKSKTFDSLKEAKLWANTQELSLQGDLFANNVAPVVTPVEPPKEVPKSVSQITFGQMLDLYFSHNKTAMANPKNEAIMIDKIKTARWTQLPISKLTNQDLVDYRDERLGQIKVTSFQRQFSICKSAARYCHKQLGHQFNLNMFSLKLPRRENRHVERLTPHNQLALTMSAKMCRNPHMYYIILLALHTAMRRGELLSLTWEQVNLQDRTITLTRTKNGDMRVIPLSDGAMNCLADLQITSKSESGRVINLTEDSLRMSWQRLRVRAGMPHLHFHDLRHEAISRLYDKHLTTPEVMKISGHRTISQVERYSHAAIDSILTKFDREVA